MLEIKEEEEIPYKIVSPFPDTLAEKLQPSRAIGESLCSRLNIGDIFAVQTKSVYQDEWELYECTKPMRKTEGQVIRINRKTGCIHSYQFIVSGLQLHRTRPGSRRFRSPNQASSSPDSSVDIPVSAVKAIKLQLVPDVVYNVSQRAVRQTQVPLLEERKKKRVLVLAKSDCNRIESIIAESKFLKEREKEKQGLKVKFRRKRKSDVLLSIGEMKFVSALSSEVADDVLQSFNDLFVGEEGKRTEPPSVEIKNTVEKIQVHCDIDENEKRKRAKTF
mmetsp:Transcript_3903/g.4508  ORF Transcript_3903/g.4508 Transcript_3903/m.4508 type:complete len:276 (-) Transcript_3903:62-889(-)